MGSFSIVLVPPPPISLYLLGRLAGANRYTRRYSSGQGTRLRNVLFLLGLLTTLGDRLDEAIEADLVAVAAGGSVGRSSDARR